MKKYSGGISIAFILLFGLLSQISFAEVTKKALLIGIDIYLPVNATSINSSGRSWVNLDGCVNDALSIKAILTSKYGFDENNINFLANEKANRDGILNAIKYLITTSKRGDIVVIYYAGHGSQIKNTASTEGDMKDETMVPSDSYLGKSDIRDKEINELFYQLSQKGVMLTVIFDSCHSGSVGRGLAEYEPKSRHLAPITGAQVNDPSVVHNLLENNVLIISAAQDDETAKEQEDEQGNPHGAFTFALIQALKTLPANAPAIKIFESTRAVIKYNGKSQEPVFEGNDTRKNSSLIGTPRESVSNITTVAILKNESKDAITIQGGHIAGINPDCILKKKYGNDTVVLKITSVDGANSSTAAILRGDIKLVKAGDMFDVTEWAFSGQTALRVFIPESNFDFAAINDIAQKSGKYIKSKQRWNLIPDPTEADTLYTVFYNGQKWTLHKPDGEMVNLGDSPSNKKFDQNIPDGSKVFVSLPAYKKLSDAMIEFYKTNNAISITQNPAEADYIFCGRYNNEAIEYAFISTTPTNGKDETMLPVRTDFVTFGADPDAMKKAVDTLTDYSVRIAKIKAWLTLEAPPDEGSFPYYLALRNSGTGKIVSAGEIRENEIYGLVLIKDPVNAKQWDGSKRFVYVSTVDSKGKSALMFPLSNVENHFPMTDELPDTIPLGRKQLFRVTPPFGYDHYILLALDEQLPNVDVFNSDAVRSRGSSSPMLMYLTGSGLKSRGNEMFVSPSSWKKQVLTIKSRSK